MCAVRACMQSGRVKCSSAQCLEMTSITQITFICSVLKLLSACELYIAPSTVSGAGLGLFAGKRFSAGDLIAIDDSLTIKFSACEDNQLTYYVFGTDDDSFANLNLGVFLLMNHRLPHNTQGHLMNFPKPSQLIPKAAHTTYPPVMLSALDDIAAGGEIFTSYGGEDWFRDRNMTLGSGAAALSSERPLSVLSEQGFCLTDVIGKQSEFTNAGRGLFALRDFKQGEIVTLSPALILSKRRLQDAASHSVMINYAISSPGSDAAVLPFGRGSLINNAGRDYSNVAVSWFNWETREYGGDIGKITRKTIQELSKASAGAVTVAYVANRAIAAGEELTLYYGRDWEVMWTEYVIGMNSQYEGRKVKKGLARKIRFRQPIGAGEGMFPPDWFENIEVGSRNQQEL